MINVIKFGGTSLKSKESRAKAIEIIKNHAKESKVVVVVSAMGRYDDAYATDTLASLIHNFVSPKEKDRLLSIGEIISSIVLCDELISQQMNATSLSIYKAGIQTDQLYGQASVEAVDSAYLLKMLEKYDVIVVPGFQGYNKDFEITTLGRGGSDYSAVILAHALMLNEVYIYSDVCGIYTADPKKIPRAQLIPVIAYQQALEIAHYKSNVINENATLYGAKYHIDMILKSTFDDSCFTIVQGKGQDVHSVCFHQGYDRITFDQIINRSDLELLSYVIEDDTFMIETEKLSQLKTPYTLLGKYAMIHFVGEYPNLDKQIDDILNLHVHKAVDDKQTYFISLKHSDEAIQRLHDQIVLEDN